MFKLKHKKLLIIGVVLAGTMFAVAAPKTVTALIEDECRDGASVRFTPGTPGQEYKDKCADHQTGTAASDKAEAVEAAKGGTTGEVKGDCSPEKPGEDLDRSNCAIISIILNITNILSGLVGVVVVLMIAVGGIQYSASRDNPQATTAAKTRIRNAILALVVYLFMYALLQYLIPGGVL